MIILAGTNVLVGRNVVKLCLIVNSLPLPVLIDECI